MSNDPQKNDKTQANSDTRDPEVRPHGEQQVKPGGDVEAGRVVATGPTPPRRGPVHAGAAMGVPHGEHEAEDLHGDDSADLSVDDSVDFLPHFDADDAIAALKTAGTVLTAVALTAGVAALVVVGVREARERLRDDEEDGVHGGGGRIGAGAIGVPTRSGRRPSGRRSGLGSRQTDLNKASLTELQRLPGVGRNTAILIVRHRPYHSVAEVKDVTGIRASAYRELRPHAKV